MAKLIKETPILRGKDAEHFSARVRKDESKKVSNKEYKRFLHLREGKRKEIIHPPNSFRNCLPSDEIKPVYNSSKDQKFKSAIAQKQQSQSNQSKIFAMSFTGNVTTFLPTG